MWEPYASAPKDGTIIRLRDKQKQYNCVMYFDKKLGKWIGMAFGILGSSKTYWDEDFCPIHEWQNI